MRVCLICVEFFINKSGGFGRAARTIGRELAARGVEVYAVVPRQGDQGPREEHDGVTVLGFSKGRPWEAYRLCKEIDADIYHSCEPSMTTVFAQWAMPRKKHIITFRDPRDWGDWCKEFERPARSKLQVLSNWAFEANRPVRRAVRRADGVYSIGRYLVPKIKQIYGVDAAFLPTPVEVPVSVAKASRPTVGWLARWDPIKRPEIFLQLPPKFPDVQFRFAGAALDLKWERQLRQTYGSAPNLEWLGRIDQFQNPKAHSEFLGKAWVMVNASTKEAMPNAFLEAAAHHAAILSGLDPDGFASDFGHHVRARTPDSRYPDAEDFAQGLAWLLENDRWREKGRHGYDHVSRTFETEIAIGQHVAVYREHLGVASARPMVGAVGAVRPPDPFLVGSEKAAPREDPQPQGMEMSGQELVAGPLQQPGDAGEVGS
jgi:glycosyltransferase involved in cell wall biosynthesis